MCPPTGIRKHTPCDTYHCMTILQFVECGNFKLIRLDQDIPALDSWNIAFM